ncbi:MAG: ATP-binding cassette domain-containing protein [bacterium]|nr:ATP-binding cassette domain-containing protein [bacterium]
MILLTVQNVSKHFGPDPVLTNVSFDIRAGEKVSLVGPNGAGKTTLLRILTGKEEPDTGTIDLVSGARLGFLQQHPDFAPGQTVWQEAEDALAHLKELPAKAEELGSRIAEATSDSERKTLGEQFDRLQHEIQQKGAYEIDRQVDQVLTGIGFSKEQYEQPVAQLSGGQQNRLLLAQLLLESPELMLLDEPSNHLDIDATEWLESYLIAARQAVIVVSHDRYFLDRVSQRTLELFHGSVDSYPGNFSAYRQQKEERVEVQRRTFDKQQGEIAKLEEFVRKHHHGQKHAQAEDRRKKLERIERVEPPREIKTAPMGFPPAARTGDIVLRVEGLSKSYDASLFSDLTFDILRGEKWGIVGPNGTGKTTLLRCLLGHTEPDAGKVKLGAGVKIGYFDQQLTCLDSSLETVDAIRPDHKEFLELERRDMLARFGVTGDMAFQTVESLSGGERNRVALAKLAASDANFLVLDEPTNHLDLWARDALEFSLTRFDGAVLFVSHDRFFLNQVANRVLVVERDRFRVIEGNYDTYKTLTRGGLTGGELRTGDASPATANGEKNSKKAKDQPAPAKRKRKFPYRKVVDLENDIVDAESLIASLHEQLIDPSVLRDGERVRTVKAELEEAEGELAELYEHWEEASELNG